MLWLVIKNVFYSTSLLQLWHHLGRRCIMCWNEEL